MDTKPDRMQSAGAPKALFSEAISLIEAGLLADAESRCLAALAKHPEDINMRALLGALFVKQDRPVEAEVTLRKVIASAPEFAKPAEDLGYLLVSTGRAA